MKKIMFNDKYGLTQAVLDGRKTQTRRIVDVSKLSKMQIDSLDDENSDLGILTMGNLLDDSRYKVGEEVAVAQNYKTIADQDHNFCFPGGKGFFNKMFVRADLMPHRIKITNIRVERLQDISEEDCLMEGVIEHKYITPEKHSKIWYYYTCRGIGVQYGKYFEDTMFMTPRVAFAALIDKVSGKGTWQSNPWVFVYDFILIK